MQLCSTARVVAAVIMATALCSASPASAQAIHLNAGDHLFRLDSTGGKAAGVVRSIDASAVTVVVDGRTQQWTLAETVELWRDGDSLRNGVIIGALAGFGPGILGGAALATIAEDNDSAQYMVVTGALGAAAGAGIGALIDSLHRGRTLVYSQSRPKVVVSPQLSRDTRGGQIAVRF